MRADSVWNRSKSTPVYFVHDIFFVPTPVSWSYWYWKDRLPDFFLLSWDHMFCKDHWTLKFMAHQLSFDCYHLASQFFSSQQIASLVPSSVYMCVGRPRPYLCTLTFWGPTQIALRAAIIQPLSWDIIAIYCTHIKYFSKTATGDGTGKTGCSCTASKWP